MNRKKWQYFLDYYLIKVLVVCIIAGIILRFIFLYFRPRQETALFVAVYDLALNAEEKEKLAEAISSAPGAQVYASQIIIDDSFRSDSRRDVERVQVLAANQALDIIISPDREMMKTYAAYGYLEDLEEAFFSKEDPMPTRGERLIRTPGMLWTDEISLEDHESGHGAEKAYILDISGTSLWNTLTDNPDAEGYLGVVLDYPHKESTELLLSFFEAAETEVTNG